MLSKLSSLAIGGLFGSLSGLGIALSQIVLTTVVILLD